MEHAGSLESTKEAQESPEAIAESNSSFEKLQDDFNKLFQCSCIWGMDFDAKKCKVLRVARIKSIDDRDYYLGGIKLDRVDVEKDLRILVSHNLSWNNHVDVISSKAQKTA